MTAGEQAGLLALLDESRAAESVKRYGVFKRGLVPIRGSHFPHEVEVVLASDHDAVVATLTQRVGRAEAQNAELVKALERAEEEITADKGGRVWTCLQVIRAALTTPPADTKATP